jgi:hypothetical protein
MVGVSTEDDVADDDPVVDKVDVVNAAVDALIDDVERGMGACCCSARISPDSRCEESPASRMAARFS